MGYQITVKANAGSVAVTTSGDVPDGEHVITGHDDGSLVSLHCERRSELGRYVIHTQHASDRQQHAQAAGAQSPPAPGISLANNPAGDDRFA